MMKKSFISLMLLFGLFVSFAPNAFAQTQLFSDLPPDHESYGTIMSLVSQGIVEGYPDGTVKPDQYIKRAELMKIIVEGMGLYPHPLDYSRCFEDVQILDEWYIGYICFAKGEGWIVGYPDGTFGPDDNINNIEILSMLFRSFEFDVFDYRRIVDLFNDVDENSWYYSYLLFAVENGLVDDSPTNYYPGNLITRAQAFEMLEKIIKLKNLTTEPQTFTNDNLTFTYPADYKRDADEEIFEGFTVFTNNNDDGVAFIDESFFDEMLLDFEMNFEDLFVDMQGKNTTLTVSKGTIVKVAEFNEYFDDYEGMFFFKVVPSTGTNSSYYVVGHYLNDQARDEVIEMIKTIEVN